MGIAIAGLAMGIAGGVMGGISQNAAAARRDQQATNNWVQGELQKGINNGKEMFQTAHATVQQSERNASIQRAAYLFQKDSLASVNDKYEFTQRNIANTYRQMKGAVAAQFQQSGLQGGTAKALSLSQSMNFFNQTQQAAKNQERIIDNINRQTENQMSQQRNDVFLPNLNLASQAPIMEGQSVLPILAGGLAGASANTGTMMKKFG